MTDIASVCVLVGRVITDLESSAFKEINWLLGMKYELQSIKNTLCAVHGRLLYLLERQLTCNSLWLERLRLVVSDIEDVIDLILTQDLELKLNGRSLFHPYTTPFRNCNMARELQTIRHRMNEIRDSWNDVAFLEQCAANPPLPCPYLQASNVIGREEDKKRIISCLTSTNADSLCAIPITGIGGMGKTTLARLIFYEPDIVARFELRLWATTTTSTVSHKFELKNLIKGILQYATSADFSSLDMVHLQYKLLETLRGKTYLLVLDDLCITDKTQWIDFMDLLAVGSPRSRILVTTREEHVALIVGANEAYNLQRLSDDDCLSIFSRHAFASGDEEAYPDLVEVGKSIVQKCHGVPLVAKTLGSLLCHTRDGYSWKQIEERELWKIPRILSSLKLSYDRISYSLRSCFAMCALYQKGCPLFKTDVINMWMALGLLQSTSGNKHLEEIGDTYFNRLLSASFFRSAGYNVAKKVVTEYGAVFGDESKFWRDLVQIFEGGVKKNLNLVLQTFLQPTEKPCFFEMHDLMHDLASRSNNNNAYFVESLSRFPKRLLKLKRSRLFAFVRPVGYVSKTFLDGVISSLKCLRILDLSYSEFEELPESVGLLKHLRYLKLGWNLKLNRLPESTSNLVNLQSLDLFRCTELEKLPKDMHKLVSLRFFSLTTKLESFSANMLGLRSVRVLRLSFCQNLISLPEEIGNLKNLLELEIFCCARLVRLPNVMKDLTRLERLSLFCCLSLNLEDWEGLYGLKKLRYLDLNELPELAVFPRGLQAAASLHDLRIQKCESLRTLREGLRGCTSLLRLTLTGCPVLTHIPRGVRNLKKLQRVNIDGCNELETRCAKDGSDWCLISHVPEIIINCQVLRK